MDIALDALMDRFLRTYTEPFTAKEFAVLITRLGLKISSEEAAEYLDLEPRIFPLEKKLYLTRAGAFTNKLFCFVPTIDEVEQGLFIAGDRCMPFVDNEFVSCYFTFMYKGKKLQRKTFETTSNKARDLFIFYGDEYVSQYIASDPANADLKIPEKEYELPTKLNITGYSLQPIIEDCDFKFGDRLYCRVQDWDRCVIEIYPETEHKKNPFQMNADDVERQKWIETFENCLLKSFDRMGPCSSIEEQLANVFYENNKTLCVEGCASIHEFLERTKKIDMERFGVESRLWKKGEDVPAVGEWNSHFYSTYNESELGMLDMPDFLIDCFLKDQMYEKKNDIDEVVEKLLPPNVQITPKEKKAFTLQIMTRNDILRKKYNWFADFAMGSLRHKALGLYTKVGALVYEIDGTGNKLDRYPQQELVILSQLFAHIMRMLEVLSSSRECPEDEAKAMSLSLEGMEYNFEDIRIQLVATINKLNAEQFEVI